MEFKFVCETNQIWLKILLKMKPNKKYANLKLKTGVNLYSYEKPYNFQVNWQRCSGVHCYPQVSGSSPGRVV